MTKKNTNTQMDVDLSNMFLQAYSRVSGVCRSARLMIDEIEKEYTKRIKAMEAKK